MTTDPDLAARLKALAHPARLRVLELLAARAGCACGEIVAGLPLAQSTVSQHIKILAEVGLVRGGADGPRPCYCIDRHALERLRRDIDVLLSRLASGPGGAACGPHSQG